jgi:hypothetical protein
MFPFPPGEREAEGASDDNPIVLVGDAVSEFKNFLWALYALCVASTLVRVPFVARRPAVFSGLTSLPWSTRPWQT